MQKDSWLYPCVTSRSSYKMQNADVQQTHASFSPMLSWCKMLRLVATVAFSRGHPAGFNVSISISTVFWWLAVPCICAKAKCRLSLCSTFRRNVLWLQWLRRQWGEASIISGSAEARAIPLPCIPLLPPKAQKVALLIQGYINRTFYWIFKASPSLPLGFGNCTRPIPWVKALQEHL